MHGRGVDHFVHFGAVRTVLLDFVLTMYKLVLDLLSPTAFNSLLGDALTGILFLNVLISIKCSLIRAFQNRCTRVPAVSSTIRVRIH